MSTIIRVDSSLGLATGRLRSLDVDQIYRARARRFFCPHVLGAFAMVPGQVCRGFFGG